MSKEKNWSPFFFALAKKKILSLCAPSVYLCVSVVNNTANS
jgi:hypothetical protein